MYLENRRREILTRTERRMAWSGAREGRYLAEDIDVSIGFKSIDPEHVEVRVRRIRVLVQPEVGAQGHGRARTAAFQEDIRWQVRSAGERFRKGIRGGRGGVCLLRRFQGFLGRHGRSKDSVSAAFRKPRPEWRVKEHQRGPMAIRRTHAGKVAVAYRFAEGAAGSGRSGASEVCSEAVSMRSSGWSNGSAPPSPTE